MLLRVFLGALLFVGAACSDPAQPIPEPDMQPHQTLLRGYVQVAPLPTGLWKGIGESSPKRLALVGRERELLALARTDPTALNHRMLGSLYTTVGETSRGLAYLADSLVEDPTDAEAWTWLGANRLDQGEFSEAITLLEFAAELAPSDTHSLTFLGIARSRNGDPAGGEQAFEAAIAVDAQHADALVPLAGLLEDRGDLERAFELLLVADRVQPNHATTLFRLARIAEELGRSEEAREFQRGHERVRVLDDLGLLGDSISDDQRRVSLGIHYLEQQRPAEALAEFNSSLELAPEANVRINAMLGRAWCYLQLNRLEEASTAIEEFRALQPGHVELERLDGRLAELKPVDQ